MALSLSLLSCGGAAEPFPTATGSPTEGPITTATSAPTATRRPIPTPRPTLRPWEIQGTREARDAQLSTTVARLATPVPPPVIIPTPVIPTPVVIVLPTITVPTVAVPTIVPPPTVRIVVPTIDPPPPPTIALPTFPPPTFPPLATIAPPALKVSDEVLEFAAVCADIRNQDESAPDWTFRGWVAEAQAVETPPELTLWWEAFVDQFALQTESGPNQETQAAADAEAWLITQMTQPVQDALLDAGCLSGYDVLLAYKVIEALTRYEAGYGQGPDTTVDEFAQACADMKAAAPTMDVPEALPEHFWYWWKSLTPPPELADYHAAVLEFYRQWVLTGDGLVDDIPTEYQLALIDAAEAMDEDVLEILLRERCAG